MLTVNIKGAEYPLATTLRVAYKVQGQHNHKSYTEVFKGIGEMHLEDQVGIVYASFECANPSEVFKIKRQDFLEAYLDTYNLKTLMAHIQEIIEGIMGKDFLEEEPAEESSEGDAKN